MIKQIVYHSAQLVEFILILKLSLAKSQHRHVLRIVDAVIVCDARHQTLPTLYDLVVDATDPSNAADFLRINPWSAGDIKEPLLDFVVNDLLELARTLPADTPLLVSVDDSITAKDKDTVRLEVVDWHYDHTKSTSNND
jgi:hypothetical protein